MLERMKWKQMTGGGGCRCPAERPRGGGSGEEQIMQVAEIYGVEPTGLDA